MGAVYSNMKSLIVVFLKETKLYSVSESEDRIHLRLQSLVFSLKGLMNLLGAYKLATHTHKRNLEFKI